MYAKRLLRLVMAIVPFLSASAFAVTCPAPISKVKSLVIEQLGVVEDPMRTVWTGSTATPSNGAWSFGRLMTNMAGGHSVSDFVRNWLKNWEANRVINNLTVPARPSIKNLVIDPWPKLQGGELDMKKAPIRLLAVVYRPDLRDLSKGKAGEGRFVYGVLDASGNPQQFTVILEYSLPAKTANDVKQWALAFQKLSTLNFGPTFNAELEKITNRFAAKNVVPRNINGSAISQIRTNEIALTLPWELREFRLDPQDKFLREVTVKRTPAIEINNTATLANWVNANASAILAVPGGGSIEVPQTFQGHPFRAGAITNNPPLDLWNSTATSRRAMFKVAINTCNGCHGVETRTEFLQISPRRRGEIAFLSGFLTGTTTGTPGTTAISVTDPRDQHTVRKFNELEFRKADMAAMLCPPPARTAADQSVVSFAPDQDPFGRQITGSLDRGPSADLPD